MIEVKDNIEVKSESRHEFRPLKYPTLQFVKFIASLIGIALIIISNNLFESDPVNALIFGVCGCLLIMVSLVTEMRRK